MCATNKFNWLENTSHTLKNTQKYARRGWSDGVKSKKKLSHYNAAKRFTTAQLKDDNKKIYVEATRNGNKTL